MKVFVCLCGHIVRGHATSEVLRQAADHIKEMHPLGYEEMIRDLTPHQIRRWMVHQVKEVY